MKAVAKSSVGVSTTAPCCSDSCMREGEGGMERQGEHCEHSPHGTHQVAVLWEAVHHVNERCGRHACKAPDSPAFDCIINQQVRAWDP